MQTALFDGTMTLERCPGYIKVWHGRSAQNVDDARAVCEAMDKAMAEWRVQRLLFDSRDADETGPEVGAVIWKWMTTHPGIERVATLVQSESLAESVNMRGIGNDLRIRSFHQESSAVRWLTLLS